MSNQKQQPIDFGYYTMMFLVFLGLFIIFGAFVLGPIMTLIK